MKDNAISFGVNSCMLNFHYAPTLYMYQVSSPRGGGGGGRA